MAIKKGKKVLIISPLKKSIENNITNFKEIYPTYDIEFTKDNFQVIKSPNTISGNEDGSNRDWVQSYRSVCKKIDEVDFDMAFLGCGSYGLPLCHHILKKGKSALYTGGRTQLMFGIMGKRWEGTSDFKNLNKSWTRPLKTEIPQNHLEVEGGCYW